MALMFVLSVLFLLTAANANEAENQRTEQIESEDNRGDTVAYESFGSPVYGPADPKSAGLPPPGKSGYNQPPPPLPAVPAGYSAYLNNPYVNPYAFNRFGMLPYAAAAAPYAYGAPYGFGAYGAYGAYPYGALGFGAGMAAGLGLPAGLPYTNPLMGRAAYNVLGYPGYAGLGYRFGGVGPAALRGPLPLPLGGPVPGSAPAPVAPAPPPPAPLPALPARVGVAGVTGKDGTVRYGYGAGQKLPIY